MDVPMLRSLMVASVISLSCAVASLPAEAESNGFGTLGSHMDDHGGVHVQQTRPVTVIPNGVMPRQFDGDHRRPPHQRPHHHHFGPFVPFGFFDGFDSSGGAAVAEPPSSEFDAPTAGSSRLDADPPPCRESTPQGIEILRGEGCSRSTKAP